MGRGRDHPYQLDGRPCCRHQEGLSPPPPLLKHLFLKPDFHFWCVQRDIAWELGEKTLRKIEKEMETAQGDYLLLPQKTKLAILGAFINRIVMSNAIKYGVRKPLFPLRFPLTSRFSVLFSLTFFI